MVYIAFSFGEIKPHNVVLPIFGANRTGHPVEFLGTGFIAGSQRKIATCYHIFNSWEGSVVALLTPQNTPIPLSLIDKDKELDLALFEVGNYAPTEWFMLADDSDIHENQFVVCPEYGSTRRVGNQIQISMATRVGNITRRFDQHDFFGKAGEGAFELSFPALRGASGAPVLSAKDMKVWGVMKSNVAYHLLPAQIEKTVDAEGNVVEETQFMLPQAIAINVKHLKVLISR